MTGETVDSHCAGLREAGWSQLYPRDALRVTVTASTCGKACGADDLISSVALHAASMDTTVELHEVGCAGWCWAEPLLEVQIPGGPRAVYGKLDTADVGRVLDACAQRRVLRKKLIGIYYRDRFELLNKWVKLADAGEFDIENSPFMALQRKRLTSAWGHIVPWSVAEYVAIGGYSALALCLSSASPQDVIREIEASGLRGRGGAGFPMGQKLQTAREACGLPKYVVANADEGDPGAYMDRGLMESDPHQLIEGMAIVGFAIGAQRGYVFTRSEYPRAVEVLCKAIDEARSAGLLGNNIFDSGFDFDVEIVCSAGAYVCGEASAMVNALEGRRPDPRTRPPHMVDQGLWSSPTCINNVETLANVPIVIDNGAAYFRSAGTSRSAGTKVFSLAGAIEHTGLVELALGVPVKDAIDQIGCIRDISARRDSRGMEIEEVAVQIGGPSGAILPLGMDGLTLDFEGLHDAGGIMGSGGIVVLGRESCVVDIARYFLQFSARESCGKCTSCRDGLAACCALYDKIVSGRACEDDLQLLQELCAYVAENSACGLGKMATTPATSSLQHFPGIYREHLEQSCRTMVCKDLMHFTIDAAKCPESCTSCAPSCPANAIVGHYGEAFRIDQKLCTKCWMCTAQCPYGALRPHPEPAAEGSLS